MTILILGASGQVGQHLTRALPDAIPWDRTDADLTDLPALRAKLDALQPDAIINAAAYTAVDRAESEVVPAWTLNAALPALLAEVADQSGSLLVHYSTDYVFSGRKDGAYTSTDPLLPLNAYGKSKLAGDLSVSTLCPNSWIIRVGWVFSPHRRNFVKSMIELARSRDELRVVNDQLGTPTFAGDIARATVELMATAKSERPVFGTHHMPGGPAVSWHEFAVTILEEALSRGLIGALPRVTAIPTSEYPTAAARPANTTMTMSPDLQRVLSVDPDWRQGLRVTLDALKRSEN